MYSFFSMNMQRVVIADVAETQAPDIGRMCTGSAADGSLKSKLA